MRHGKAEQDGPSDVRRELAPRGRRDLVACSISTRTRQTWDAVASGLGGEPPPVDYHERIYNADVDGLLTVLRETPAEVGTLLLVGHNLGMPRLVVTLDADPDGARETLSLDGFPTASLAVLRVACEWSELEPGTAKLASYNAYRVGG
jgi:phosphohistidine phosphatase